MLEVFVTEHNVYVGSIVTEHASGIDENDDDVPSIIIAPPKDKNVEIWIPKASIKSRTIIQAQ